MGIKTHTYFAKVRQSKTKEFLEVYNLWRAWRRILGKANKSGVSKGRALRMCGMIRPVVLARKKELDKAIQEERASRRMALLGQAIMAQALRPRVPRTNTLYKLGDLEHA